MTAVVEVVLVGVLSVSVFLFTLVICLAIAGKQSAPQLLALGTPWAMGGVSLSLKTLLNLYGYHDYLSLQALGNFFLAVALMNLGCVWWVDPIARARVRQRRGGIAVGILISVFCLALVPFLLRAQSTTLLDLVTGPQAKRGVVQDLDLWTIRGSAHGGVLVVDGVRHRVPDLSWFGELSMGQSVEFLYGPETGLAFAADRNRFSLLAALLIAGLLGLEFTSIVLAALEPGANGQARGASLRSTSTAPTSRSTRSLLRMIQEQREAENGERAKQEKES